MSNYTLESEQFIVTFNTIGAELISAKRKSDGREYIWEANPDVWKRHSPVLFPIVGRYRENLSIYDGKEYKMSQHGFARDMEFELKQKNDNTIWFQLEETHETLEKYPFKFRLECGYRLIHNSICVMWKVTNTNDCKMYFSIGGHPAFAAPSGQDTMVSCGLQIETDQQYLDYSLLNSDGCMENHVQKMQLSNKCVTITPEMFDKDAIIVENNQTKSVALLDKNGEPFVTVNFTAPLFGLWSPGGKNVPFVCIEPWYGRTDKLDYNCKLENREWGNSLEPGKVFEQEYHIIFE